MVVERDVDNRSRVKQYDKLEKRLYMAKVKYMMILKDKKEGQYANMYDMS